MDKKRKAVCLGMSTADVLIKGIDLSVGIKGDHTADSMIIETGGDALNQSIVISKLGHEVTLMSLVGNDAFGEMIQKQCQRYQVGRDGIFVTDQYPTSVSVVCIREDGQRSFITHRHGTVDAYALEHMDLKLLDKTVKVLSVGSMGGSRRLDGKSFAAIFTRAKENGTVIAADMVDNLGKETLDILKESLPFVDYLIPSQEEMLCFTGNSSPKEGAAILRSMGVRNVIIKLGGRGVYIDAETFSGVIPAFQVPVADTTGAGDNFTGGFVSGLLEGYGIRECALYASAVAALSIQSVGAVRGVENRNQVESFLHQNKILI